ncbi:protein CMSS1-like isoform X2 [Durio zibethinus]|uniref:Protein CMSS1-like isoform X2 n=1 Tax=Durio zibethinus TaxID=66656 RepID=A0A6P5X2K4_DURZI|nr:protein CMSS1-like isoform X2 [Durio zibethinus]
MGSGKHKPRQNPKPNAKLLRPKKPKSKFKKKTKSNNNPQNDTNEIKTKNKTTTGTGNNNDNPPVSTSQQLGYFVSQFQSANGVKLSSLELESIKELGQDVMRLEKHIREAFAARWKEELCEGKLIEGKIEAGSPAVLVVATSALRSIELLRGMRSLTKECRAVKLFSKHMKIDEQVSLLKHRVNIASGTPTRIKKLIDIEALGLSRLSVILLDIHTDVKGYSLLTLPQVRDEFWDLYKNYFHQQVVQGDLRICLYGPIPNGHEFKGQSVELVGDREQLD